jgi:hypothetical protein
MYWPDQQPARFFTQNTVLVVVWQEHLVPYLQNCLNQLDLTDVKAIHVEDWIASHLRPYVPMGVGTGQHRVSEEAEQHPDAMVRQAAKEELRRYRSRPQDFGRAAWPLDQGGQLPGPAGRRQDHSFKPRKTSGRTEPQNWEAALGEIVTFLEGLPERKQSKRRRKAR